MVWCFTLFLVAFDSDTAFGKTIACTMAGSVCGALAFGCLPPIALGNIVVIAMLVAYLRTNRLSKRKLMSQMLSAESSSVSCQERSGALRFTTEASMRPERM